MSYNVMHSNKKGKERDVGVRCFGVFLLLGSWLGIGLAMRGGK